MYMRTDRPMKNPTTIKIEASTRADLQSRRIAPTETYDHIIKRLMKKS